MVDSSLKATCRQILHEKGRLSTAIPGFKARAAQNLLVEHIAQAIEVQQTLIAEAGTGTGKTYAYLLPCLLSGRKTLISTATKTLQDQLYLKDLPTLIRALGLSTRVQNLKGRANYICQHRVHLHAEAEGGINSTLHSPHEIAHIRGKLSQMHTGDRAELPEISEDSPVWPWVTSTVDNCLGNECSYYEECFLVKARKRAMEADLVVINHHLFFADSRLKEEGFGEILPGVDILVFDEAHQLAEIATHFNGERIGTKQFKELMQDMVNEWPALDRVNHPLKALMHRTEQLLDELYLQVAHLEERISWHEVIKTPKFMSVWSDWLQLQEEILTCLQEAGIEEHPALKRCQERFEEWGRIHHYFTQNIEDKILWLERFKQTLVFHATPYHVEDALGDQLKRQNCTYIFTSATLTVADSFDCFRNSLGLTEAQTLLLPSPFDYQNQALLYLPRSLPDPKDPNYYSALLQRVIPVIKALGGRCFFLFTSHRALRQVAEVIQEKLHYPVLVQGSEAKPILLERFRQLGNAILLGTASFWEGVDVKGDALSCVIIDKLPFASPNDPVVRGKMASLKNKGLSGFDELSLPNAVIALKQGVGRLIRDSEDKGILIIADPRLTGREYGHRILASLPPLPKTRDELKILDFIKELALDYEPISD